MIANIAEAKAQLSQLVERAYRGETVIIAKNGTPLVNLTPYQPPGERKLGRLAGQWNVPDDFLAPDPDIEAMFYGQTDQPD